MAISLKSFKHVAMYLRISQEKRSENFETLSNHRSLLTEFANNNGFSFVTYEEVLSGGASELEQRPQLQKLLNELEQFDAILVVELSRLSRNGLISEMVLQFCKDYDKPIITPDKIYDLANNDNDVLTFRFGSLIASQEHALIGKRSKSNKIQMARAGFHISGSAPFGYVRNSTTKKLEINEEEAKTVRYIFTLHSQGLGSYKIRDILNKEGYKSAKGNSFNLPSIKRIVRNPVYKGWNVFTDRKKIKKNGKFVYEIMDRIVCKNAHPSIVEDGIWDEVNRDCKARAQKSAFFREKPALKTGITMLKDLIYCNECGKKMTIRKDNKLKLFTIKKCEYVNDRGEKCSNAGIKLEHVERNVMFHIKKYRVELTQTLESLTSQENLITEEEHKDRLKKVEQEIKKVEEKKCHLIDLALTGIFTHDELKEKRQELMDNLSYLKQQHENLLLEANNRKIENIQEQFEGTLSKIETIESKNHPEELNQALKLIIKKVYYSRVLPNNIAVKSTRSETRRNFPYELRIEFY